MLKIRRSHWTHTVSHWIPHSNTHRTIDLSFSLSCLSSTPASLLPLSFGATRKCTKTNNEVCLSHKFNFHTPNYCFRNTVLCRNTNFVAQYTRVSLFMYCPPPINLSVCTLRWTWARRRGTINKDESADRMFIKNSCGFGCVHAETKSIEWHVRPLNNTKIRRLIRAIEDWSAICLFVELILLPSSRMRISSMLISIFHNQMQPKHYLTVLRTNRPKLTTHTHTTNWAQPNSVPQTTVKLFKQSQCIYVDCWVKDSQAIAFYRKHNWF